MKKNYGYSTKLQVEPWRHRVSGEKYIKEASTTITSTSRTSNGVHKVHPSNNVKYESQKEKTKPGIQPWFHTKVTNQRGGAEIRRRREKQQGKDLILG